MRLTTSKLGAGTLWPILVGAWLTPAPLIIVAVLIFGVSISKGQDYDNVLVQYDLDVSGTLGVGSIFMYDRGNFDDMIVPGSLTYPTDGNYDSLTLNTLNAGNFVTSAYIAQNLGYGAWWNGSQSYVGSLVGFQDLDNETSGNVTFLANSPQANWNWAQNGLSGNYQMFLDWQGNLTLIDSNTTNNIIAVPGNFSLVLTNNATVLSTIPLANVTVTYPATTFSGNGNLSMGGNVVLNESDDTLNLGSLSISEGIFFSDGTSTTSIGDFFYTGILFNNGASITLGSSIPGLIISTELYGTGLGIGPNANATNDISIAIGSNSTATGIGSITLSHGTSSGNMAIAIGNVSAASGNDATAISGGNATGDNSVAIGIGTVSETWGTTVIGRYNSAISGNATAWSSGDPSFIVGIGGNSTTQKNGLVVYNNGTCLINGNSTFANPSYVSPTSSTQPQEFQVGNTATFNGQVTLAGNIIITEPQGDIPVGEYDSSDSH